MRDRAMICSDVIEKSAATPSGTQRRRVGEDHVEREAPDVADMDRRVLGRRPRSPRGAGSPTVTPIDCGLREFARRASRSRAAADGHTACACGASSVPLRRRSRVVMNWLSKLLASAMTCGGAMTRPDRRDLMVRGVRDGWVSELQPLSASTGNSASRRRQAHVFSHAHSTASVHAPHGRSCDRVHRN